MIAAVLVAMVSSQGLTERPLLAPRATPKRVLIAQADGDGGYWVLEDEPPLAAPEPEDGGLADAGVRFSTRVVGQRGPDVRRITGSAITLQEEDLERRELNDIHRVLGEVPGVYFREEDGLGLRPNIGLRGANPDRSAKVTLMEDGVLLTPAPYSAPAAYYFPLVTRMVGVDVFKGPAAIRFGPQTIGGAINLRTREVPRGNLLKLDVAGGSRFQARVHGVAAAGSERWGVLAEGVFLRDDGFKVLDRGGNTGFERSEFMIKGRANPGDAWRQHFEVKATLALEDSRETYLGLARSDFEATPDRRYATSALDRMQWNRLSVAGRWSARPTDALTISAVAYRHSFLRTWNRLDRFRRGPGLYELLVQPVRGGLDGQYLGVLRGEVDSSSADESLIVLNNQRTFVSQGVQLDARLTLATGPVQHELEAGLRFHHDEIRRNHTATGYAVTGGLLERDALPVVQDTLNLGLSRAGALHLNDTMTWGRLLLSPGLRVELIDGVFADRLSGRATRGLQAVPLLGAGAVVALPWGLNVFGGVHQGFSPVTPGQGTEVQSERALHAELGLRAPSRRRRLELVGFWSEYSNITGECTGSAGCVDDAINRQFNGGAARIIGLEALASVSIALPADLELVPQVTYTLTSARFLSDFTSSNPIWGVVRTGDLIPYVPTHQGSARLIMNRDALSLSVGAEFTSGFIEEAGDGVGQPVVPGRLLLDATASYRVGLFQFYVQGTNLTNQRLVVARRPFGARPLAPLAVQGGVRVQWP
ncbi:MAG: TonB-dependent receptor [Myxococcaceae bacterium]|nr:TonB-dependent receptor [Myxococcaceae bacterium]